MTVVAIYRKANYVDVEQHPEPVVLGPVPRGSEPVCPHSDA